MPAGLRPHAGDDLHVTLAFLGDCATAGAEAAWVRLLESPPPRLSLRLGAAAAFGHRLRPGTWGFDLDAADPLRAWMRARRDALTAAAGAARELREPRPHLSVAHGRAGGSGSCRDAIIAVLETARGTPLRLNRVALYYRSKESAATGLRYQIWRWAELGN